MERLQPEELFASSSVWNVLHHIFHALVPQDSSAHIGSEVLVKENRVLRERLQAVEEVGMVIGRDGDRPSVMMFLLAC